MSKKSTAKPMISFILPPRVKFTKLTKYVDFQNLLVDIHQHNSEIGDRKQYMVYAGIDDEGFRYFGTTKRDLTLAQTEHSSKVRNGRVSKKLKDYGKDFVNMIGIHSFETQSDAEDFAGLLSSTLNRIQPDMCLNNL